MEEFLKILLDFINLATMICVVERKFLVTDIKRIACSMVVIAIGGAIAIFAPIDVSVIELSSIIIVAIAAFVSVNLPVKRFVFSYIISILVTNIVEQVVGLISGADGEQNKIEIKLMVLAVVVVFSLIVIFVFKKTIDFTMLPKSLLIGIGILFGSILLLVSGVAVFMESSQSDIPYYYGIVAVVACVAVFGVAFESIMLEISKLTLQKENEILQRYNDQQKKYYELVLKSEEDTRRFRHDMLNHIICLEGYLQDEKVEECKEYLTNITRDINMSRKKLYHTGNKIADVMLTNIFQGLCEGVEISITGRLKEEMGITDYDLCIVISNIIKNAVEAVNKQNEASEKYIKVNLKIGKKYLRIEERNTIDPYQRVNAEKLETAKEDKRLHGLGMKNVKQVVERYKGTLKKEVTDNEFYICVDLVMNNDVKE